MAKNYIVQIILNAEDKGLRNTMQAAGRDVEGFSEKAEGSFERIAHAAAGAAIAYTFGRSIPIMRNAIDTYNELRAAQVGLQAIVQHTNEDWERAQAALQAYTADGLIPVSQASAALKNLLLRGFGLERSIELLYRLKDAAAYGRQGSLSMGQAVQSATEGLKNMNPILVDNAGVTKNMSIMYREYAETVGTSAGKLTDRQKIEAEYQGILRETQPMLGNAAKLTEELGGKMAAQEAAGRTLNETIGAALEPSYTRLLEILGPVTEAMTRFAEANPKATATLLGGAGLVAAIAALAAAFTLIGPGGAIVVGLVSAIIGISTAVTKLAEDKRRAAERSRELAVRLIEERREVEALWSEYKELRDSAKPVADAQERMDELAVDLAEHIPGVTKALIGQQKALDGVGDVIDDYVDRLRAAGEAAVNMLKVQRMQMLRELGPIQDEMAQLWERAYGDIDFEALSPDEKATDAWKQWARGFTYEELLRYEELGAKARALEAELATLQQTLNELEGVEHGPEIAEDLEDAGKNAGEAAEQVKRFGETYWELARLAAEGVWDPAQPFDDVPPAVQEAMDAIDEYYDTIEERSREAAIEFRRSFKGQLQAQGRDWVEWGDEAAGVVIDTGELFSETAGAIVSGNEEALAQLTAQWDDFFQWLVGKIIEIIVEWLIGKVLMSIGLAEGGGTVSMSNLDVVSSEVGFAQGQHGGKIIGPVRGLDRVPTLAMVGETYLSTDLTQRMERFLDLTESGGAARAATEPQMAMAGAPSETTIGATFNIKALDAASLRDMIRNGPLGRELLEVSLFGRLPE